MSCPLCPRPTVLPTSPPLFRHTHSLLLITPQLPTAPQRNPTSKDESDVWGDIKTDTLPPDHLPSGKGRDSWLGLGDRVLGTLLQLLLPGAGKGFHIPTSFIWEPTTCPRTLEVLPKDSIQSSSWFLSTRTPKTRGPTPSHSAKSRQSEEAVPSTSFS